MPDFIDGLINLNNQIIPQIDAQSLLYSHIHAPLTNDTQQTLLAFKCKGPLYALRVGYVLDSITVNHENIDFFDDENNTNNQDYTLAESQAALIQGKLSYRQTNGSQIDALIFSPIEAERIISDQNNYSDEEQETGFLGERNTEQIIEKKRTEYLIFNVAQRQFAVALTDILEVIDLEKVQKIQHGLHESTDIISGLTLVRDKPLAVLDLNYWFKTDHKQQLFHSNSVMVISHDDYYCAIAIDNIVGMIDIEEQQTFIDPQTQQLMLNLSQNNKNDTASNLSDSYEYANIDNPMHQQQLIEVFSTRQLIQSPTFKAIESLLPKRQYNDEVPIKTLDVLKFQLHNSTYGILIDDIQRVINNQQIEPLLSPKAYITGSCEYDGLVIPVIDLAAQLATEQPVVETKSVTNGLTLQERIQQHSRNDVIQQEAIVVNFNHQSWALAINESESIIEIKETNIDFLPEQKEQLVKAYASFDNELIHLLNINAICTYNT